MNKFYFLDNKFASTQKAKISISDLGFLRGFAVFDLAVAKSKNIFMEHEHLERLSISAKFLSLKMPYPKRKISEITHELLRRNKTKERVLVRWIIFAGKSRDGQLSDKEFLAVLTENYHRYHQKIYSDGINLMTCNFKREIPQAKTTNYQLVYSLYPKMRKEGFFELLFVPNGNILEAGTSNFFIVKNGQLITPKDDILLGVTRQVVLNLANKQRIPVAERKIKIDEIKKCQEAFITATNKKVMPVARIDGEIIGSGRPGEVTKKLMRAFEIFEEEQLNQ